MTVSPTHTRRGPDGARPSALRPLVRLAGLRPLVRLAGLLGIACMALVCMPPAAIAAPQATGSDGSGPAWSALTPAQRSALAPLQNEWPRLDESRKAKWLVLAGRFPSMPEAERRRVQARMTEWARMSPAERGRARQNFQELRSLNNEDRHALWEAYRALPDARRAELAKRAGPPASAAAPDARASAAGKRNIVRGAPPPPPKSVAPTIVQARPGATTNLVTTPNDPPLHHQPGLPKITATEGFVNPSTLLPRRGPQGAAAARPRAASGPEGTQ